MERFSDEASFFVQTFADRCAPAFLADEWIDTTGFAELKEEVATDLLRGFEGQAFASLRYPEVTFFQADVVALAGVSTAFAHRPTIEAGLRAWAAKAGFAEIGMDDDGPSLGYEIKRPDGRATEVLVSFEDLSDGVASAYLTIANV